MSRSILSRTLVGLVLAGTFFATAVGAKHDESTIVVDNKSQGAGEITFKLTPVGGEPTDIKVGIIEKMQPSEIARDIMKAFDLALGDDYVVKMKNDQTVSVEGNPKVKDREIKFAIAITGVNVPGVSVVIK